MFAPTESSRSKSRHSLGRRSLSWLASALACALVSLPSQAQDIPDSFVSLPGTSWRPKAPRSGRRHHKNGYTHSQYVPELWGSTNGTIGPQGSDTFSGGDAFCFSAEGIYAPINSYAIQYPYDASFNSSLGGDTPFRLPVSNDIFSNNSDPPPADWWKEEK